MIVINALRPSTRILALAIWLVCLPLAGQSYAQQAPDVRLVVDISGSMKRNDPANLRQPAVELLVQLLPAGAESSVWTFGQYATELVPHGPVDDNWKQTAVSKSGDINSVGLFTNIGLALEEAGLSDVSKDATNVIILTDGMVDIAKDPGVNEKEWRRIVDEVIPKLRRAGVRVHTIALSDKADSQLLNKLALATNGKAATAKTADELMKAFLATFDQAAPAEQVPLAEDRFAIDSSVEEFTALVFRKDKVVPTVLQGPDGSRYSLVEADGNPDVSWFSGLDYDLITLQQPLEGEWQVLTGIAPDSRVTVVSNLNLVVKTMPTNLFRGQRLPVDVRLQEDGETITAMDFLQLVDLTATTFGGDEGRQMMNMAQTGVPANGIFRSRLPHFNQPGEYELTIALDGKSFQRQIKHSVTVRDAFAVEFGPGAQPGMPHELSVTPFIQTIDFDETSVIALIKTPSGGTSILPVPATQVDDWLLKYSPKEEGVYTVNLTIDVVETNGTGYEYNHPEFEFSYPEGEIINAPEPQPPEQEEPEPEPAEDEPEESELEPEDDSSGLPWWIYVALGVGNLLIFGLAYFAYRKLMGGKKDKPEDQEEKEPEQKEEPNTEESEPEEEAADDALAMADIDDGEDVAEEPEPEAEPEPEPEPEIAEEAEPDAAEMDDASDLDEAVDEAVDDATDASETAEEEDVFDLDQDTESEPEEEPEEEPELEEGEAFSLDQDPEPETPQDLDETADTEDAGVDEATDLAEDEEIEPAAEEEAEIPDAPMDDLEAMLAEATADLPDLDDEDDEEFTLEDWDPDKK
ncbi:vWA domain-containing protein [Halioxenophilus aromaticivorans]|uniref:VWFA domain-containing protein n=1 Tax=Halioxenophilus aromaticivorans TaxID=1306992 RepID=A0AAV3TYZ4_9ALTE